jgi:arylsulfatase
MVDERPDLILVMTDQQRHDNVGYAPGSTFDTPNLDGLAGRGVVFDTAYSGSTVCVPSRISLLTGLGAHRVPRSDGLYLPEGHWTVARELAAAGYQTAIVGKGHFRPMRGDYGFETMRMCEHLYGADLTTDAAGRPELVGGGDDYHRWLVERGSVDHRLAARGPRSADGSSAVAGSAGPRFPLDLAAHPTSWVEREALEVLARRDPDRPLYLVVSFPHPHDPLDPPEPYESMYDPTDSVLPTDGFEVNDGLPWAFREPLTVQTGPFRPSRAPSEGHLRSLQALVRGLVRQIDDALGRILTAVDLDRSVVCFTSDHGDYGGHRGMLRKVPWIPFDDLWRVPLVLSAPDAAGGRRSAGMVQNLDWVTTALDYAGVPFDPEVFESRSLRPALTDPAWRPDPDRPLLGGVADGWPTIRLGHLKLITRAHFTLPGRALFDLDADPGEQVDLADDAAQAGVADELEDLLRRTVFVPAPELPGRP